MLPSYIVCNGYKILWTCVLLCQPYSTGLYSAERHHIRHGTCKPCAMTNGPTKAALLRRLLRNGPSLLCCALPPTAHTENTSSLSTVWGLATKELRTLNTCKAFAAMHRLAYFIGHQQKVQSCSKLCKWKSYVPSYVKVHWWKYHKLYVQRPL